MGPPKGLGHAIKPGLCFSACQDHLTKMQQQMIDGGESPAVQRGLQFQKKLPCCFKPLSQTCGWAHFCSRGPESLQIVLTFCEKLHLSGRDLCYLMGKSPLIFFFNLLQQLLLKLKRPFNALKHHRWPVIIQWIIFYAFSNSLHTA